jgi:plastocyanin
MRRALGVWVLLGSLAGAAQAGPVKGTLKLPDDVRPAEPISGHWRVENGLLPVQPAADARGEAIVVLEPATPSKADPPTVVVELKGLRMEPRVLAVPVGATVQFKNVDRGPHTLFVEKGSSMMAPEPTPAGQTRQQRFLAAGEYKVRDDEYPHLWGMILAVPSPYSAPADAGGSFKIDAPDGKYTARVWWRGAWVLSQPVTVGDGDLKLVVKK